MPTDFSFLKKHGFHKPPKAYFEIKWDVYGNKVESVGTCKCCGATINISFRGNPDTMSDAGISDWVLKRTEKLHQCPAVMSELAAKTHKFYNDIKRGNEKLKEQEYKRKFMGHS